MKKKYQDFLMILVYTREQPIYLSPLTGFIKKKGNRNAIRRHHIPPPPEADSMLLQVTVGCAHNQCAFCNMYRDVRFRMIQMEQIEADLEEARGIYPKAERIFLVNGDAFVLNARRLKEIAGKIGEYFPECNTISMYASIRNIESKTDAELNELRKHGINDLYIGVESGSDDVVAKMNKGHTAEEAGKQLYRLNQAGIGHIDNIVLGLAGTGRGIENAQRSAAFLNNVKPKSIWIGTLAVLEGTPLFEQIAAGRFIQASEREKLLEEKAFLNRLDLKISAYTATTPPI
jgi:radical SAM superfamily enzyme YgiQ (UPF0313 family)